DREQLAPGRRQVVLKAGAGTAPALDDAGVLQLLEAPRQQRGRHARHAALQVVEAHAADQQLANDERRPALRQHFRGQRHRTELAVAAIFAHGQSLPPPGARTTSYFAVVDLWRRGTVSGTG